MHVLRLIPPAAKLTFGNPRRGSWEAAYRRGMDLAIGIAYEDRSILYSVNYYSRTGDFSQVAGATELLRGRKGGCMRGDPPVHILSASFSSAFLLTCCGASA